MSVSGISNPECKEDQVPPVSDPGARPKVLTEKGLSYQINLHEDRFKSALSHWRKASSKVLVLLSDSSDAEIIRESRHSLQNSFDELSSEFGKLSKLKVDCGKETSKYEEVENDHHNLIKDVTDYIKGLDVDRASVYSGESRKSSKMSEAAARAAALKAELKYMDLENKTKAELQKIQTLKKLEIAEAELEAIKSEETVNFDPAIKSELAIKSEYTLPSSNTAKSEYTSPNSNPAGTPSQNVESLAFVDLAKSLSAQLNLGRLPTPEPAVFNGDPLAYPSWKVSFQTLIESRQIPQSERIHYLKRYVSGPVKDVIDGFLLLPTDEAFVEAKKVLDKRYGDPFIVANAFRDRLEKWPKVSVRDGKGLQKFGDFLNQCQLAMQSNGGLSVLNDDRENRKLLLKLPDWLVPRWGRLVAKWKNEHGTFPPFKKFAEFVVEEATLACDPITSLYSLKNSNDGPVGRSDKVQSRSFVSSSASSSGDSQPNKPSPCLLCSQPHELNVCSKFLSKSLVDRKAYVKEKHICYACLRSGHLAKKCRKRKTCTICGKLHPSALHGDIKPQAQNHSIQSTATLFGNSICAYKSSMIVPVYVSHSDNPDKEHMVYALLDTQSDTTFILENSCTALGVSGVNVKLSLSTMYAENCIIDSKRVQGLQVRGIHSHDRIDLPVSFSRDFIPASKSHVPTPEIARSIPYLRHMENCFTPLQNCEIGLLIGYNCPKALTPREVVSDKGGGPFAQRTDLGWGIMGVIGEKLDVNVEDSIGISHRIVACQVPDSLAYGDSMVGKSVLFSLRTKVKEVFDPVKVLKILESDFSEQAEGQPISSDDKRFLEIMDSEVKTVKGRYELPLPFKSSKPHLPDNRVQAEQRLKGLRRRLDNDSAYKSHYFTFMENLIAKGYAEKVPNSDIAGSTGQKWYIPHHGVYHPHKPNKVRVVFDCSARHQGHSLNDYLLSGPDLTNKLLGVLCRFRQEHVAFTCDVEQMFYQFGVRPADRDYLRFLWYTDQNLESKPVDYRMAVHLFGARSSPGCANYGFKKLALDHESQYGTSATEFLSKNFYVDDGLKSVAKEVEAIQLIQDSIEMCKMGGLRLHKFVSNSKYVLSQIKPDDCARDLRNVDLYSGALPIERVLGTLWCPESDTFQFHVSLRECQATRRNVLSIVSSVYDPLGLIAPVVLTGKQILQTLCAGHNEWDEPLPESLHVRWNKWCNDIKTLDTLRIDRCFKPPNFGEIRVAEMHHFSDASAIGYGHCSYIRLIDHFDTVHCSLIMGKSRVVPIKPVTIPRLELSAAVMSVRIARFLDRELSYINLKHYFWTDSTIVLGYISNEAKRFHVFVANRISEIRQFSEPTQWSHVRSEHNPADIASRGVSVQELSKSLWFRGPDFLWEPGSVSYNSEILKPIHVQSDDPELKKIYSFSVQNTTDIECKKLFPIIDRLDYFSDWVRAKLAIAWILRFKTKLRQKIACQTQSNSLSNEHRRMPLSQVERISLLELQEAELEIIRQVQSVSFKKDLESLKQNGCTESRQRSILPKSSSLFKLNPFLDSTGVLRVGGRVSHMVDNSLPAPIVLPRKSHITTLIIRHCHEQVCHQGRGFTLNQIRSSGYWILGCSSAVSYYISRCVSCRRLRGTLQTQKMADLPLDRVEETPPFTYVGVDLFGPYIIKNGRKELKRYGVIFTCLSCRAIHLETADSLDTSSFMNALRRFMSIRGPIKELRSDRGTNIVGTQTELRKAVKDLDEESISRYLLNRGCNYFRFNMNVPSASHMGGVWERQIRTVRNVLAGLLLQSGSQLDDEALRTFLSEAAAIVNSRPLTVENLNDPMSLLPLTPNHLLTMKSQIVLPPPGDFTKVDLYSRKRWRRIQYLANEFWYRWRREYLSCLQSRNKWQNCKRNLAIGDIVLVSDENLHRCHWKLGCVSETTVDDDGLVRKVKLHVPNSSGSLERPIHKLILLCENE